MTFNIHPYGAPEISTAQNEPAEPLPVVPQVQPINRTLSLECNNEGGLVTVHVTGKTTMREAYEALECWIGAVHYVVEQAAARKKGQAS